MADAWSVDVEREPEWDEYSQAEAIAGLLHERRTCGRCGLVDSYVAIGPPLPVTWPDGRVYVVQQHRCLACAAMDIIQRDSTERSKDHKPEPGQYSPRDGLRITVTERR